MLFLVLPSSTFLKIGGKEKTWRLLPHLKKRKSNPLSWLVFTASCTEAASLSFDKVFQLVTDFPICGSTYAIWMSEDPQTFASQDTLISPESVRW